jgi:PAS domain S-box-containing protein
MSGHMHTLSLEGDFFSRFVRESSDAIAISRLSDGRLIDVNQPFLDMMGFSRQEVIGRTTLEIGLWAAPEEREEMLRALEDSRSASGVEFELHTSAGDVRYIEASVQLLHIDGEPCILAIDRDVTDRRRAEALRRETEEMLRATIESTADGILVVDNRGRTAYANHRFATMWRVPQEILETNSDERMLAFVLDQLTDPDAFLSKVRELYQTDHASFDTLRFKDGRTFERYSVPMMHDGRIAGRVWSFRDVTERRRAEEAIREAEERYRTLVEQIPAVTYADSVEEPAATLYISPQAESMFGYSPQEWLANRDLLSTIVDPDDAGPWREAMARRARTGEPYKIEYRVQARDGRVVWVQDEAVLVRGGEGGPRFWQGVMFDVTERKLAEEQLEQAWQRELEAGQRLRALDQMKNTFLEAVSHELRTPLTAVLGSALTLEREDVSVSDAERRDLVRRLASNARKLNRLLADLLDLDRLARGIVGPKREPIDLTALVRWVVRDSELLAGHPVEVTGRPFVAAVDGPKVERIVENLVANSARHTPMGTPIRIRVERAEGGALLVVDDEGPGVPAELRESIFEPFRQEPSSRPHQPGVGIGLTLVARFAELHGGRAWVDERTGGGASFRVFLSDDEGG